MRIHPAYLMVLIAALAIGSPATAADVAWRAWDDALAQAAASGKPVVVDVYTDWCGWCKRMDKDVYGRADVRDYLAKNFVAVKLDAEASDVANYQSKRTTSRGIAQQFRVSGYPTTVFLSPTGEHIVNVPGYVPPDRFLLMLRYFGEEQYKKGVKWPDFERSKGAVAR